MKKAMGILFILLALGSVALTGCGNVNVDTEVKVTLKQ